MRVQEGLSLNQLRLVQGSAELTDAKLKEDYQRRAVLFDNDGREIPLDKVKVDGGLLAKIGLVLPE